MKSIVIDKPHTTIRHPKVFTSRATKTRVSRGGLDEINPEDIIYGEYSSGKEYGEYIDLIYLDDDILRTFSGGIARPDKTIDELMTLLRDDNKFYLVEIKEVERGLAFKRNDIVDIKTTSLIEGNSNHEPSCKWTIRFEDKATRGIEISFQSYFTYGKTTRPSNITNAYILDKVLGVQSKHE